MNCFCVLTDVLSVIENGFNCMFQDDSNSMNPDISMPTSPLDQAGPSGVQESKPTAGMFKFSHLIHRGRALSLSNSNERNPNLKEVSVYAA